MSTRLIFTVISLMVLMLAAASVTEKTTRPFAEDSSFLFSSKPELLFIPGVLTIRYIPRITSTTITIAHIVLLFIINFGLILIYSEAPPDKGHLRVPVVFDESKLYLLHRYDTIETWIPLEIFQ